MPRKSKLPAEGRFWSSHNTGYEGLFNERLYSFRVLFLRMDEREQNQGKESCSTWRTLLMPMVTVLSGLRVLGGPIEIALKVTER